MLTRSELFPQLPPNIQGKPFLPFQRCLPSGNLLQTSELLVVCSCSFTDIQLNTTRRWVLLRKASGSSSLPLPLAWVRAEGTLLLWYLTTFVNYCFPGLSESETRDSVNDKFYPLPLVSRLRTAFMKSFHWNQRLDEKRSPTHHLIYNAVKSSS